VDLNPTITVQIGKHTWVSGLTWVPLTRPRHLVADAKVQVDRYGGTAYVVRPSAGMAQVGIASADRHLPSGVLSLAGAVADTVAMREFTINGRRQRLQDWVGLFQVGPDAWFLLAVRDGAIVPNCDRIGPYDYAYDLLEQTYGIGGWAAVLGSPNIGDAAQSSYHNFVPLSIEDAIGLRNNQVAKPGRYALRPLKSKRTQWVVLAIAALFGVCATGWYFYQKHLEEKAAAELAALQAEMAVNAGASVPKRQITIPHGWATIPTLESIVRECVAHLEIPAAPGTWDLSSYTCNSTGSNVQLARNAQTHVGYLHELIPDAVVATDQNTAEWKRPFGETESSDEELIAWNKLATQLFAALQAADIAATISEATSPAPPQMPPEELENVEILPADWHERSISIGPTQHMPSVVSEMLNFPGVRITNITASQGQWTYEGTIYAK